MRFEKGADQFRVGHAYSNFALALGAEGFVGFAEVGVLHAGGLDLGFGLDRGDQVHRGLLVERLLGDPQRHRRAPCQPGGNLGRLRHQPLSRYHPVVEPDLGGALGGDEVSQHEQLARVRHADDPGQEPRRSHVGAGQAHPRKEKGDLGVLRRDPDVAGGRDHGPRAGDSAVERRHDRPATLAHGQNEIAGEAGELEQARGIPREQRADDVLDIAAAAERSAGAGDDDGANAGLGVERAEGVPELGVDLEGERVEPLGPVERDGGDRGRGVDGVEERSAAPHRFALCCAPSTAMQAPVIQLARSDARKATTSATSSGVPIRPHGIVLSTAP